MPETFVVHVPLFWSPGMAVAYGVWVVMFFYAAWRFALGLKS